MMTRQLALNLQRTAILFAFLMALLSAAGCQRYYDYDAFLTEPRPVVTATEYRMEPPDVVLITSKRVRELNGHREMVRTDGKLTLPLLGSVYVANRTTEEVSAMLERMAREYYDDADVSVRVVGYNSKKIFVFGEVGSPGVYPYNGGNTVLETLASAQPSRLADPTRIQILRPNADGERIHRMTIDLNKMVRKGDTSLDAVLEEGDIIYVPANAFATVGLALQQLLLPIQPAAATVEAPTNFATTFGKSPYEGGSSAGGGL